jgi:hypothetical protein
MTTQEKIADLSIRLSDAGKMLTDTILKCPPTYELSLHAGVRSRRVVMLLRRAKRAVDRGIKRPEKLIADLEEELVQHELTVGIVPHSTTH